MQESSSENYSRVSKIRDYMQKDDIDSAMKLAEEYDKTNPDDIEILGILVQGALKRNSASYATSLAKRIVELDPKNAWGYYLLAQSYRAEAEMSTELTDEKKEELFKFSIKGIEKALQLDPDSPWINIEGSLIYLAVRNKAKAVELIEKAYKNRPFDNEVKQMKERIENSA